LLLLAVALARMVERNAPPAPERAAAPAPAAPAAPTPTAVPAPPSVVPPSADASVPYTKLPLRLLATVVSDHRALSLATIDDVELDSHAVMREGQAFEGRPKVLLAAIERERVLLDNDGAREQLVLIHEELGTGVSETERVMTPEEREHRRELARRLRELTDEGPRGSLRGGLLAEGDVSAAYEDGELIGVQVDGVRAGGLYDRIGLKNGDVVTDIGGVSLADPDAMVKVLEQAFSSEVLPLKVRGPGGTTSTLELPVEELQALGSPGAPE
jgi:type II secretion system protein C